MIRLFIVSSVWLKSIAEKFSSQYLHTVLSSRAFREEEQLVQSKSFSTIHSQSSILVRV